MSRQIIAGSTSELVTIFAYASGVPLTGKTFADFTIQYAIDGGAPVALTEVTMTEGTWVDSGVIEKAGSPGYYQVGAPDLSVASGKSVIYSGTVVGGDIIPSEYEIVAGKASGLLLDWEYNVPTQAIIGENLRFGMAAIDSKGSPITASEMTGGTFSLYKNNTDGTVTTIVNSAACAVDDGAAFCQYTIPSTFKVGESYGVHFAGQQVTRNGIVYAHNVSTTIPQHNFIIAAGEGSYPVTATTVAGGSTTVFDTDLTYTTNDQFKNAFFIFKKDTATVALQGVPFKVSAYDGTTTVGQITVDAAYTLPVAPSGTDVIEAMS